MASSDRSLQRQIQNRKRHTGPPNPEVPAGVENQIGAGALHATSTDTITLLGTSGHTYTVNILNNPPLGFSKGTRIRLTNTSSLTCWAEGPISSIDPSTDFNHIKYTFTSDRENLGGTSSTWKVSVASPPQRFLQIHFTNVNRPDSSVGKDGDVLFYGDVFSNEMSIYLKQLGAWVQMIKLTVPSSFPSGTTNSSSGGDSGGDSGGGGGE